MAIANVTSPSVGDPGTAAWADQVAVDLATLLNPTVFLGRQSGSALQTLTTATLTAIGLDTEDLDTYSGHSTSSNTSQFVVPSAMNGWRVRLFGLVIFATNSTSDRHVQIQKNSVTIPDSPSAGGNASSLNTYVQCQCSVIVATGDVLAMFARQDSGGNLATIVGSRLEIVFAGLS